MGKRRTISFRDTALLSIAGGGSALLVASAHLALRGSAAYSPEISNALGIIGVAGFFLGTAAGVLALSTPYIRMAIAGLGLNALALAGFVVILVTRSGSAVSP